MILKLGYNMDPVLKAKFKPSEDAKEVMIELQSIIDSLNEPIILINEDFNIIRINKITLTFSGKSKFKEVVNRKCYSILYDRDDCCPYCPIVKRNKGGEKLFIPEKELVTEILVKKFDKNLNLILSFFPLVTHDEHIAFVEKIHDVTLVKEKDEENLRMRNLASIGILVSGIAHELNNPMTGIGLTLQSLESNLSSFDSKKIYDKFSMMKNDLHKASGIISDILSFSKLGKLNTSLANLRDIIIRAKNNTERIYPDMCKNIEWRMSKNTEYILKLDASKIERLFENLFLNSLQAIDYKSGFIEIKIHKKSTKIIVSLIDSGDGISKEIKDKIFDPFYTKSKSGKGTGLGLSICHSIMKEHEGSIVINPHNSMTEFLISFPSLKKGNQKK